MAEKDSFCRECIDKYLLEAKKQFPDIDNHLLEICIAQYLLYDVEKREKPDENLKEFVDAKNQLELLTKPDTEGEKLQRTISENINLND